ncbi:GerMN domain-containing protein [Intrasporangium sp.]|uniref:GerMN domain-containing protein n=1 Tax=Intrasporangium sp. TaxID=1925024 RepID=UPI003221609A
MPAADRDRARRPARLLSYAACGLLLAGCGIGPQDRPVVISIPPQTAAPVPSTVMTGVPLSMQVYLLKGAHLFRVTRTVAPGPGLQPTLAALSAPLSPDEQAQGLRSAIPVSVQPLRGSMGRGDIARVDVPTGFDRLPVQEQVNALGQLVFTITADTLATGVQLVEDGRPVAVPDASGQLQDRAVTREDYGVLAPRVE